jgi:hypothetical protein
MKVDRYPPSRIYRRYQSYRAHTRAVFRKHCAYCFANESEMGGEFAFAQDHFEPIAHALHKKNDPNNLYWCCGVCNSQAYKGHHWPTDAEALRGIEFCDPCDHDPMGHDYRETIAGRLLSITPSGRFTIEHIGLNRDSLVALRKSRRIYRRDLRERLRVIRAERTRLASRSVVDPTKVAKQLALVDQLIQKIKLRIGEYPFRAAPLLDTHVSPG